MKLRITKAYYSDNPKAPATLMVTNIENGKEFKLKVWDLKKNSGLDKESVVEIDKDKITSKPNEYTNKYGKLVKETEYTCIEENLSVSESSNTQQGSYPNGNEKDRRISRLACLKVAGLQTSVPDDTIALAGKYEAWVYRNGCKDDLDSRIAEDVQDLSKSDNEVQLDEDIPF